MNVAWDLQVTSKEQITDELVALINQCAEERGVAVRIRDAGIMGRGLFAVRDIEEGESISKYGGRMLFPHESTSGPYVYAFDERLFGGILQDPGTPASVKASVRASIAAWRGTHINVETHFKLSEMGRWVNSVRENKEDQNVAVAIAGKDTNPAHGPHGRWDIEYVAITAIRAGEQLFTDYGAQHCLICSAMADTGCARCNAPYCGPECQRQDWPAHAKECLGK
jgi:hypothetical protein